MAKKAKTRPAYEIADELEQVRSQMAQLKAEDARLSREFLEKLHDEGLTEAGNYKISKARSLKVANETKVMEWVKNYPACLTINVSKVKKVFQLGFEDPTAHGFKIVETERIIPKGGASEDEE